MHRLVSPTRAFAGLVGDPGRVPLGGLLGLEHEFMVHRDSERLDARRLLAAAPDLGRRLDPGDPHARRRPGGWVLTCDGREAEVALPPVAIGAKWPDRLRRLAGAAHQDLARVLPGDLTTTGASTHLSVSSPDGLTVRTCQLLARTFAPAIMLLLDGRGSPGLLVRPRPGRVELGGDYQTGEWLTAAAAMAVGAVRVCCDALAGEDGDLPDLLDVAVEPAVDRFGWYVDRRAFGGDLYRDGAATELRTVAGGSVRAGAYLRACWRLARTALTDELDRTEDLAQVDELIHGRAALPCTGPHDRSPLLDIAAADDPPRTRHALPAPVERPEFTAVPVVLRWDLEVWWLDGRRRGYASVPRRCLPAFHRTLATGRLDASVGAFLDCRTTGRTLISHEQAVASPALWDAVTAATDLIAAERDATGTPQSVVPRRGSSTSRTAWTATASRPGKGVVPPPATTGHDHVPGGDVDEPAGGDPWLWVVLGVLALVAVVVTAAGVFGDGHGRTGEPVDATSPSPTETSEPSPSPSPVPTIPEAWVPTATALTDLGLAITDTATVIDGISSDPIGDWIWSEPDVEPGDPDPSVDLVGTVGFPGQLDAAAASALELGLLNCADPRIVCPADPAPLPAGDVVVVVAQLAGPVPPDLIGFEYVFAAVFDSDGDPANDFAPTFAWDFFQGADRWYVAVSDPGSGDLQLFAVTDGGQRPVETGARVLVGTTTVTWIIPADEFGADRPSYRTSAFRSQGAANPSTSAGDVPGANPTGPLLELLGPTLPLDTAATGTPTPPPSPTSPSPVPASPSPSPDASELLATFLTSFSRANERGDVDFLAERLHPAVVDRYGAAQCRDYLASVVGTVTDLRLLTSTGPVDYGYPTDGLTTSVRDAYRLTVDADVAGERQQLTVHYALVEEEVRWFTDCGDPR